MANKESLIAQGRWDYQNDCPIGGVEHSGFVQVHGDPFTDEGLKTRLGKRLEYARMGGETKRFHTMRNLLENTVGHHSFNVAWLCHFASIHLGQAERYTLMLAALAHDLPEHIVGDVPAPSKRDMGIREEWNEYEASLNSEMGFNFEAALSREGVRVLKFCDSLDGAFQCAHERALGNSLVKGCYDNFMNYAAENLNPEHPHELALFELAQEAW